MNTYDQGLKVIADTKKTVERVVELHTAGKNINEIVGTLVADSMREAVAQMLAATPAPEVKPMPMATPGWVLHAGSATCPVGLMPTDRVEVRCDIGSETSHVWAVKDVGWQKIAEWRMAPVSGRDMAPAGGRAWTTHTERDMLPRNINRRDHVDVKFNNGRGADNVLADNVDWFDVTSYRKAS